MRTLKKTMCIVLALVMMLGLCVVSAVATNFTDDVSISAAYAEAAEVLDGIGVFKGYADGSFKPKTEITRGEVAAILYRVVTGDVNDRQVSIYKDYNKFTDVPSSTWYAGYVNFVENAELVKGHGDGTFGADDNVTGYQVLAMMLRAVGYGKAGEFEGDGWQIQTAATAKRLGITDKIDTTTLGSNATREEVAEMIFQAIQLPKVTYSDLLGYQTQHIRPGTLGSSATAAIDLNASLGYENFGLVNTYGIVVGNQSTGEDDTRIAWLFYNLTTDPTTYGPQYYDYTEYSDFDIETDLDCFGHAVKVWFDDRDRGTTADPYGVYAMFDQTTMVDVVEATDGSIANKTDKLYEAADKAGFKINNAKNAHMDNAFNQINDTRTQSVTTSPIGLYALISNSDDYTLDVVIALEAQVAQIGVVDNSSVTKTLTLTNSYGKINQKSVTAGSTKTLGANVVAWKITGTAVSNTNLPFYELEELTRTVTGTVASYNVTKGTVNLKDGTTLTRSPLYGQVKSGIDQVAGEAYTNSSYIFYLDNDGKYLGARPHSDASFIYGTYADYQDAGLGTGDLTYYLSGVDLSGNKVTNTQIKKVDGDKIADVYSDLEVAQKALRGDAVIPGYYVGYTVDSEGNVSTDMSTVINEMPHDAQWKIESGDVKTGYFYDTETRLYLNANTKFIVVSGTGSSSLTVKTYNGISELLGDASDVTIDGTKFATDDCGAIYYTRSPYYFSNVLVDAYQANVVILPEKALNATATSNLYFIHDITVTNNDTKSSTVRQFEFYQNGEKVNMWIETDDHDPVADSFYKLVKTTKTTANGDPVYTIKDKTEVLAKADGVIVKSDYTKETTSDWFNGTIDDVGPYNLQNAKVIDLTDHKVVDEITNVAELNHAATLGDDTPTIKVCCVLSEAKNTCMTVSYVYIVDIIPA